MRSFLDNHIHLEIIIFDIDCFNLVTDNVSHTQNHEVKLQKMILINFKRLLIFQIETINYPEEITIDHLHQVYVVDYYNYQNVL